jgi:low temperature requirement protein LtrA
VRTVVALASIVPSLRSVGAAVDRHLFIRSRTSSNVRSMSGPENASHRHTAAGARYRRPMTARSPHEPHRVSTPLELFFDLVFVVAISQAAAGLHHAIGEGHALEGIVGYLMVFFAIWWAWMNFTWFASAYDCDDVLYRLIVFVQIAGALILAAGIPAMFETHAPNGTVLAGYIVMRLAMVTQWLRAAAGDPHRRAAARRYAIGITIMQIAWIALLLVPSWMPGFLLCAAGELAVPIWAERAVPTTWHPHHIAERYGLLTLIVLGESILAATVAVQSALSSGEAGSSLAPVVVGGLLIAYSIWWMYFDRPAHGLLVSLRKAIKWGYGHYAIFAAAAAVGAGLAVSVDQATHHAEIGTTAAGAAVAIPVAAFLLALWFLHDHPEYGRTRALGPIAAALVLLTPFTGHAVPLTGAILATLVAVKHALLGPGSQTHVA